ISCILYDEDMSSFLSGKTPMLEPAYNKWQSEKDNSFDIEKRFLVNGNGGDDTGFLFRSILTKWKHGMPIWNLHYFVSRFPNDFFLSAVNLRTLYNIAYGDTIETQPSP